MGYYTDIAEMVRRFGADELVQVTNDRPEAPVEAADLAAYAESDLSPSVSAGPHVEAVAAVITTAITDAESEIDSYLQSHYSLPLDTDLVPAQLTKVASDMARYHLFENGATSVVKERYDNAVRWLKDVALARVDLGLTSVEAGAVGTERTGGAASIMLPRDSPYHRERVFASTTDLNHYLNGTLTPPAYGV